METTTETGSNQNNSISPEGNNFESIIIQKIFINIKRRWWLFIIIALLSAIGGFFYAASQRPTYESYLSFALDEGGSGSSVSDALGLASQFGLSIGGAKEVFTGDNILEIMLSRRMIENTLLSVDTFENKPMTLIEFYLNNDGMGNEIELGRDKIHFYPGEDRNLFSYTKDSIIYSVYLSFKQSHIDARRPDKKLNIYELMIDSHNEKFSKVFTDRLIYETNQFYTVISSKKAKATLQILESRVPDMKGKLDATIADKAAIADANLNTAFADAQVPLTKAQSNIQVYGAAYAEMFKNLEMARFQYLKSIPLMQIIDDAKYPLKKIKLGKLKTAVIFSVIVTIIFLIFFIIISFFRFKSRFTQVAVMNVL